MAALTGSIQIRKDTAANWTSNDPTLLSGELGLETDTRRHKTGDGVTAWSALSYDISIASDVRAVVLTGLSLASSAAVAATDTILAAFGKLQAFNDLFTTVGLAIARLANPSAVTFLRMNADNTATARTASEMRTDLGLGTWALENLTTTAVTRMATYSGGSQAFTSTSLADVTSTEFTFPSTGWYDVEWFVLHDAAATTTGSFFSINGTAVFDYFRATFTPNTVFTDRSSVSFGSFNGGTVSGSSVVTTNNRVLMQLRINVTTVGTVFLRCATEIGGSAITVTNVDGWMQKIM